MGRAKKTRNKPAAGTTRQALRWAPWVSLGVLLALWPGKAYGDPMGAFERGRGRHATRPSEITRKGWRDILWRTWKEANDDQITRVAGGVTFFGLLALFPALAAFVALYGLFADVAEVRKHLAVLAGVLPHDILVFVGDQLVRIAGQKESGLSFAFIGAVLLSLWSANAGMKALFQGLNIAYDEREKRGIIRLNLVTLAFTVGAVVFMMIALAVVVAVPIVLSFLGLNGSVMALLRWPALLAGMIAALAVVYRYGPSREHARWRWVTWGGVGASVLWIAGSLAFSLYLTSFAHYDRTYGSFGALIGVMMWLWMSSIIVLLGAELNSEIEHQTTVDSTTGAPQPMGARGAEMADTVGERSGKVRGK
ncbi:MAG: YihY/virulence factor BrkB family protein [Caulobacteraceae bacterium]